MQSGFFSLAQDQLVDPNICMAWVIWGIVGRIQWAFIGIDSLSIWGRDSKGVWVFALAKDGKGVFKSDTQFNPLIPANYPRSSQT